MWRSLTKIWHSFRDNICWTIGNGQLVRFFQDVWIPQLGVLRDYILPRSNPDLEANVSDFISAPGDWDWGVLRSFFPKTILEYIAACHPRVESSDGTCVVGKLIRMGHSLFNQLIKVFFRMSLRVGMVVGNMYGKILSLRGLSIFFG